MKKRGPRRDLPASTQIDGRIAELGDWRGDMLSRLRTLIRQADPDVVEEWKWAVPAWSHDGLICTGETYKSVVKLTFARGAALDDPSRLFNSSLEGNTRRAIDLRHGDKIDAKAFKALVRAAVKLNLRRGGTKPRLLSGGNPQIAKGEGDAPVQAYITAMPGWKRDVGRRLDALITRAVPGVRKAVRWNSPFYGREDGGWLLSFHCYAKYVKVAFFSGASLRPPPPGASKQKDVRYLDIREGGAFDERRFEGWVKQARRLPGVRP